MCECAIAICRRENKHFAKYAFNLFLSAVASAQLSCPGPGSVCPAVWMLFREEGVWGVYENKGAPKIDPQILGFPYTKDPNKVPPPPSPNFGNPPYVNMECQAEESAEQQHV